MNELATASACCMVLISYGNSGKGAHFMGGKYTQVLMGVGGTESVHTNFICENNRKSNKIMHCFERKKILIDSFQDKAIFHVIQDIDR